jgi:hypothetical protein
MILLKGIMSRIEYFFVEGRKEILLYWYFLYMPNGFKFLACLVHEKN